MSEKRRSSKFLLPVVFALILVLSLAWGVRYMRTALMKLTIDERSDQMEEMVKQIRANLKNGLQTHWNLVSGLNNALQGSYYENGDDVSDNIAHLENDFCTDLYGCRVMLLDEQGTAYLSDGPAGIWYDVSHLVDGKRRHTFVSETDSIDGSFLVFSQELDTPITMGENQVRLTHVVLLKDIQTVKQYYTTTTYGGSAATYIIRDNGTLTYYDAYADDIIGARNVYKALREVEYIQGQNFDSVRAHLDQNGIAVANILLNRSEYYYCLTSLEDYDMTLMLLIPAEAVAVSTMSMMESTIKTLTIFMSVVVLLLLLAAISFVSVQRSAVKVRMEQETNKELNRLRMEAESANAAKSTFLNNMSHDIRTPMNAIIGFTNIALKHNPKPEVKACLEKISDSSEHLLTLINDVLDISRIESGRIQYTPVPVDIVAVANTVVNVTTGFLSNRNLTFHRHLEEPEARYVLADAVRIREVLVNILGNAVKFTPDGGTITFEASYRPVEDGQHILARYRIADTGVGMSEDFIGHIFDEFSQEENSARTQYKGTGLGMAITRRYVELMGGTISVESRKGKGSTFIVEIPMARTDGSRIRKQDASAAIDDLAGVRILLAEDNDLNAEIATIQMERLGARVTRAADGRQAVCAFAQNPPGTFDVILMDIMMPEMDGHEATAAIRNLANRPDALQIPIIAMTANAFAEDVQAAKTVGMNEHIAKPLDANVLARTLQKWLCTK